MPKEKEVDKPSYIGHRQRLKTRFEQTGFRGFHDYEVLEFLLYFVLPRKDTKKIAKTLLERFGDFIGVLNADTKNLREVNGIGSHAAFFLKTMGAMVGFYFDEKARQENVSFTNVEQLVSYFRATIGGRPNEVMRILHLNSKNRLIHADDLSEGTVSEAVAFPRKIVEGALKYRATTVIIAHNHPGGVPEPSNNDDVMTKQIQSALQTVKIILQEHIIVASDGFYSYRQNGYFDDVCG
jgi:DNA repair protein RadC